MSVIINIQPLKDTSVLNGTSFYGYTVTSSVDRLTNYFGINPDREGSADGKTSVEWDLEIEGIPFSLYDWKEPKFSDDEIVQFHIGTHTEQESKAVCMLLDRYIKNVTNGKYY